MRPDVGLALRGSDEELPWCDECPATLSAGRVVLGLDEGVWIEQILVAGRKLPPREALVFCGTIS